ncbi:MAG TPA: cytochrome c family protein [Ensifer sp.]|nr:cytochrome c family protein [Ensifer sp.]
MYVRTLIAALAVAASAGVALADGDATKGAQVFKKNCMVCHNATDAKAKVGPSLQGVVGRPVASVADFKYSDGMKTFGAGKTWTEEELTAYLPNPKELVPGTKMAFAGLKAPQDIADLIAYLKNPQ